MNGLGTRPLNVLSLFSGAGGLDLGLRLAVPGARVVCCVERDSYAQACLVARMAEASLEPAPIWDRIETFDGRPWRGVVDCVAGGSPCPDLSVAGKRAGITGPKSGLWEHFIRIVAECDPELVWWENVSGATSAAGNVRDPDAEPVDDSAEDIVSDRALGIVLGQLAALGFDVEWGLLKASAVGAPHERARLFVLAYSRRERVRGAQPQSERGPDRCARARTAGQGVADAAGIQRDGRTTGDVAGAGADQPAPEGIDASVVRDGIDVADSARLGRAEGRTESGRQQGRSDAALGRDAVANTDRKGRGVILDAGQPEVCQRDADGQDATVGDASGAGPEERHSPPPSQFNRNSESLPVMALSFRSLLAPTTCPDGPSTSSDTRASSLPSKSPTGGAA